MSRDQVSTRMASSAFERDASQLITIILGLAFFWQLLRPRNVVEVFGTNSPGFFSFEIGMLLTCAIIAARPRLVERVSRDPRVMIGAAIGTSLVFILINIYGQAGLLSASNVSNVIGGVASSIGVSVLVTSWYTLLCDMPQSNDSPLMNILFVSYFLSLVLGILMFSLSPLPVLLPILSPIISGLLCVVCISPRGEGGDSSFVSVREKMPAVVAHRLVNVGAPPSGHLLVLLVIVDMIVGAVLWSIDHDEQPTTALWLKYLLTIVMIAIMFFVFYRTGSNERKTTFCIWYFLSLILIICLSFMGLFGNNKVTYGASILTACKSCSELLVLFLLTRDAFEPIAAYRNLSALFIGPSVVGILAGNAASLVFSNVLGIPNINGVQAMSLFLSIISSFVLLVAFGIIILKSFDFDNDCEQDEVAAVSGAKSSIPDSLYQVAVQHFLTARETQIMAYAFRGYSLQHIAELDGISINTVKSHWKNVYRKLGVHSRQELIDMVEGH